jgi:cytochrome P450
MTKPTTDIDIISPEAWLDPADVVAKYKLLRAEGDIFWIDQEPYRPFWAVLRHADIMEVERNGAVWLNEPRLTIIPRDIEDATIAQFGKRTGPVRTLLDMDQPDHRKHRNVTQAWFNSKFLDTLRDRMASLATEYVDKIAGFEGGVFDFAEEIAVPYPLTMITAIMGLPETDAPLVLKLTQELFGAQDPDRQRAGDYGLETTMQFFGYLSGIIQERRADPKDDLMSVIASAQIDGAPMADLDALSYGMVLAAAGHDTTSSTIGVGMMQLALNPGELAKLKADPETAIPAAQEMFRYATPVRHFARTAATDTSLAGQTIAAGESVALFYLSANRDEAAFDDPEAFHIDRSPNRHLGFGYGAHHCLGRVLAEMEVEALFREIGRRVETVELAGDLAWVKTNFTGGLKHCPIRIKMKS